MISYKAKLVHLKGIFRQIKRQVVVVGKYQVVSKTCLRCFKCKHITNIYDKIIFFYFTFICLLFLPMLKITITQNRSSLFF